LSQVALTTKSLGIKKPSPVGTATFVGLRALDPLLQYGILAKGIGSGLLAKLGLTQLKAGLATNTGITVIDKLGLSPYRLILLSMSIGSTAKHINWLVGTSYEEFTPGAAVAVSVYNTFMNSVNNLLFTTTLASASLASGQSFPQWPLVVGALAYVTGLSLEITAEVQRRRFKEKNPGKPFTGGLWSTARHINYTGYALWRAGFACAAAGFGFGGFVLALCLADFNYRSIPELDQYCSTRVSRPKFLRDLNRTANDQLLVWAAVGGLQEADSLQADTLCLLSACCVEHTSTMYDYYESNPSILHGSRLPNLKPHNTQELASSAIRSANKDRHPRVEATDMVIGTRAGLRFSLLRVKL
jgi:protein-S-isoprenylcysteine O-methyltransferase Ste14